MIDETDRAARTLRAVLGTTFALAFVGVFLGPMLFVSGHWVLGSALVAVALCAYALRLYVGFRLRAWRGTRGARV